MAWTSEQAIAANKKGNEILYHSDRSPELKEKKRRNQYLANIRNKPKYARDKHAIPEDIKIIVTPTPTEKILGIETMQQKAQLMFQLSPCLGSKNAEEFFEHYAQELAELKAKIINAERRLDDENRIKAIAYYLQYIDREMKFADMRFGLSRPVNNVMVNNAVNVDLERVKNAWNETNKKYAEITEADKQKRVNEKDGCQN